MVRSLFCRGNGVLTCIDDNKASSAIGGFQRAWRKAALTDGCCLLVTSDAADGQWHADQTPHHKCQIQRRSPLPLVGQICGTSNSASSSSSQLFHGCYKGWCDWHWWRRWHDLPPVSRQMRKLSIVPKHSSPAAARSRAPSTLSRIMQILWR